MRYFTFFKKIGLFILILSIMLIMPAAKVYSGTEIKFVKEDTVCQEILDLGLTEGTMNYGKNLTKLVRIGSSCFP